MSSPLTRNIGVTVTPSNVAALGLSPLASSVIASGATVLIDGHRVRLGSPIERLVRTPRASAPCAVSASVRDRGAAKVHAGSAALLAERQRAAADAAKCPAAEVASPVPEQEPDGDAALAALLRNPPEPEDTMIAALRRDAAKGSAK